MVRYLGYLRELQLCVRPVGIGKMLKENSTEICDMKKPQLGLQTEVGFSVTQKVT